MRKKLLALVLVAGLVVAGWLAFRNLSSNPAISSTTSSGSGNCPIFPANNIWNTPVDQLPVTAKSAAYIQSIGANTGLHPDFGTTYEGAPNGIPFITVPQDQPKVPVNFDYADESDPGPYPIPPNAPIEGVGSDPNADGDRHMLVLQQGTCKLYEMWDAHPQNGGASWQAGSGAVFDLNSNQLRLSGWTSADAAGLPILPGLVRRDEIKSGAINHALRFTVERTRNSFIWPARHQASSRSDPNLPPMGQRFRLKAGFDISSFSPENKIILTALKKYGMIVADNGSNWFISGAPNPNWNDEDLARLGKVRGADFEAVDVSSLQTDPNSGQVK